MKHTYILTLILSVCLITGVYGQTGNTISNPINIGTYATSFTYADSKNSSGYTDSFHSSGKEYHTQDVFYRFYITHAMDIIISHCESDLISTCLYVLDSSGNEIHALCDTMPDPERCGNSWNPYLVIENMPPGVYYIVSEGNYENGTITTNVQGTIYYAQGNTMYNPINIGTKTTSFIYTDTRNTEYYTDNYDVHGLYSNDMFHKITITQPMDIIIKHCGSDVDDTYLYVLNAQGNKLYDMDDCDTNLPLSERCHYYGNPYLKIEDMPAGTYYIVSEPYHNYDNGNITVEIQGIAYPQGNAMYNPINVGTKTTSFNYTNTQNTGNFKNNYGRPSNDMFHKFTITQPMDIIINHCGSSVDDTYLYVLDAQGTKLYDMDDCDINLPPSERCHYYGNPYLKVEDMPAGTYYIVSEPYHNNDNGDINVEIHGIVHPVIIEVPAFNFTASYDHTFNTATSANAYEGRTTNDVFYKITLMQAMDVEISHCGSEVLNTYLSLLNSSMSYITHNDNYSGTGECSNTQHSYLKRTKLAAGTYYVVSEGHSQNGNITTTIKAEEPFMPITNLVSKDHNYIITRSFTNEQGTKYLDQIAYFDGLGRPLEVVQKGITPQGKDLVTYQEYDNFGRESNTWLPRTKAVNNGEFLNFSEFKSLSDDIYNDDTKPYAHSVYEASPLNRLSRQYGAGEDWNPNVDGTGGHYVKTDHPTNSATDCAYYYVSGNNLARNGHYPANQLFVTKLTDEDGNISFEFKDKLGRVILTRQINNGNNDTYYVYDDFNNLRFVIPPEAAAVLGNGIYDEIYPKVKLYCYIYRYDGRNRCIYRKLPGTHPVFYVYDNADRVIFTQDGEMRETNPNLWLFTISDVFGRPVITGTCMNSLNYTANPLNTVVTAERTNVTDTYKGYTLNEITLTSPKVLTVNYYDDYGFMGTNSIPDNSEMQYENLSEYGTKYDNTKGFLTGTLIGEDVMTTQTAAGTNNTNSGLIQRIIASYTCSVMYYDYKGQVIQSKKKFNCGGMQLASSERYEKDYIAYNFTGQPIKQKTVYRKIETSLFQEFPGAPPSLPTITDIIEEYAYTYDHAGRLMKTTHKLDNGEEITLADNTYDELGRLKTSMPNNQETLKLTYSYNVRGWITEIAGQRFRQRLFYNQPSGYGNTLYWNGNISAAVQYNNGHFGTGNGFNYTYDNMNRLTKALNFTADDLFSQLWYGTYNSSYQYDRNGNITGMFRAEDLTAEKLTIGYEGNRRDKITYLTDDGFSSYMDEMYTETCCGDYTNGFIDYSHGNGITGSFAYNKNGSLSFDPAKNAEYHYNVLRMPKTVKVPAINGTITYNYNAAGEKLSVNYKWHNGRSLDPLENSTATNYNNTNSTKIVEYVGNKVYENGALKMILLPNGYISNDIYYFYLRDHLGNNCIVTDADGNTLQSTFYHPYGKPINGESSGQTAQPYKFGGKEQETMFGLETYDFSARTLDEYGIFTTMDPLAEKYYNISPYAYCFNNPIRFIDPDGRDPKKIGDWLTFVKSVYNASTAVITLGFQITARANIGTVKVGVEANPNSFDFVGVRNGTFTPNKYTPTIQSGWEISVGVAHVSRSTTITDNGSTTTIETTTSAGIVVAEVANEVSTVVDQKTDEVISTTERNVTRVPDVGAKVGFIVGAEIKVNMEKVEEALKKLILE